ncbi:MAG: NHL repeat-containing protein [Hyphomicrobiales bacterium]|nr:NHL repeat-containing protein [Hyphomicrobiales bacterium]
MLDCAFLRGALFGCAAVLCAIPPIAAQQSPAQQEPVSPLPFATFDAASEPVLADPHDVVIGPGDRLYVADKFANRIAILDRDTLEVIGSFGDGELSSPHDVDFDAADRAIIADTGNHRIAIYDLSSGVAKFAGALIGIGRPEGALAHPNGRIYATSSGFGAIMAFENGIAVATAQGLSGAHDIATDSDGNLWVADTGNRRIVKYSPDLEVLAVLDDPKYRWAGPRYLDVDPLGRLVVADQDAHRIVMIGRDGALIGVLGNGVPGMGANRFDDPEGVEIAGSMYFFADSDNNRIVRYQVVMN